MKVFIVPIVVWLSGMYASLARPSTPEQTKVYAIVFPQFHSDPLNDKLWGANYTDWDRLKLAPMLNRLGQHIVRPLKRHGGYYNLLEYDVRKRAGDLAKEYNIDGFLYYHYWWNQEDPRVTLHGPIEKMLSDGEPDRPFAFIWVRDPWSCSWQGQGNDTRYTPDQILVEVKCPPVTDAIVTEHYKYLKPFFQHKNYIHVNGVPLFIVMESTATAQCDNITKFHKMLAMADGYPAPGLHISRVTPLLRSEIDGRNYGKVTQPIPSDEFTDSIAFFSRVTNISSRIPMCIPQYCFQNKTTQFSMPFYLSIITSFDNTPRRNFKNATIFKRRYTRHGPVRDFIYDFVQMLIYESCCQDPADQERGGKFMMVNAWNEWGEGNVLEPSNVLGYTYLKAVQEARSIERRIACNWDALKIFNTRYLDHDLQQ